MRAAEAARMPTDESSSATQAVGATLMMPDFNPALVGEKEMVTTVVFAAIGLGYVPTVKLALFDVMTAGTSSEPYRVRVNVRIVDEVVPATVDG